MKKITSVLLAALLLFCVGSFSAFAETYDTLGDVDHAVKAKYLTGDRDATYSIDIAWGGLEFDYNANEIWDAANHTWVPGVTSWSLKEGSSSTISVTNNSSVAVSAVFAFTKGAGFDDVGGTFSSASLLLDAPASGVPAVAQTIEFTPSGTVPNTIANSYTEIGTITVTLEENVL